jgi:hypothetical protein
VSVDADATLWFDRATSQPSRAQYELGMAQSFRTNGHAPTRSRTAEPGVRAYLEKMARLRTGERRLQAAAPGSKQYDEAAGHYERLTQELMDDFARAVRSVR